MHNDTLPGRAGTALLITLLAVALGGAGARGGSANPSLPDRVIVAIPDSFPIHLLPDPEPSAVVGMIMRRPDLPPVIILERQRATAAILATAVEGLRRSREDLPAPERDILGLVKVSEPFDSARPLQALQAVLDQVHRREKAELGNLGTGRWMELPAARLGL